MQPPMEVDKSWNSYSSSMVHFSRPDHVFMLLTALQVNVALGPDEISSMCYEAALMLQDIMPVSETTLPL